MSKNPSLADGDSRRDSAKAEFWRALLGEFAGGGQSVRAFCAGRGVSEPSFYSWRRRLARRDAGANSDAGGAGGGPVFVPVHVAPEEGMAMEVVLRGERRIRLGGAVDAAVLAEVVAALESVPVRPESSPATEGRPC